MGRYSSADNSFEVRWHGHEQRIITGIKDTGQKVIFLLFLFRSLWVRMGNTNILHTYNWQHINLSQWWTLYPWSTSCPMYHSYHV